MKKLVSLFLILAMTFSLVLSVSAEGATPSASFDAKWYTYTESYNEDDDVWTWNYGEAITEAKPGDKIVARVRATKNNYLANIDYTLTYDSSILTFVKYGLTSGSMAEANEQTTGVISANYANTGYASSTGFKALFCFVFEVKAEPVKTLSSIIDLTAVGNENAYYADGTTYTAFDDSAVTFTPDALTIIGLKEETKEFAVEAKLDTNGKVVVTAENIGKNAGTVYVATYNAGVLVDCEAKALADIADGWTVENLDGTAADAQIYVWNDQNVPLFDNVITVSAE